MPANGLYSQTTLEKRQEYLRDALKLNIEQRFQSNTRRITIMDSTYADWLQRTGALPPDFSAMRSYPFLPDPLTLYKNGKEYPITTPAQWEEQRDSIKARYQRWVSGKFPPAPGNIRVEFLADKTERGVRQQMIRLTFGPGYKGMMTVELLIPEKEEPKPVFMTQWKHREWALLAVKRGYIGCVYAADDEKDDTEAYRFLYPDYDFSMLMRRAWGASRVVDYLLTRKEVNKKQIAISGHSRNGKQSLWAAAFDSRIAAVISNSSSTGGDMPWRFTDPQYASETIDFVGALQAHWFLPGLRFFFGHEDKLPVDQNQLGALIAPRPLLFHYSIIEAGLNSWANEQNYYSVKRVYDWMKVPENVGVLTRYGDHFVNARDIEQTIDFLDIHFKRNTDLTWTNTLYYPYQFNQWKKTHRKDSIQAASIKPTILKETYKDLASFNRDKDSILQKLQWLLGEEPPAARSVNVGSFPSPKFDWISYIIPRPQVRGAKMIPLNPYSSIGEFISGSLYCPVDSTGNIKTGSTGKLPVIIYSHQYAYSTGFSVGYDKDGHTGTADLITELVSRGYAVLAIDMFGFGTRIAEATNFYQRHPEWSKMGKMSRDLRACIDAVEDLDYLDEHKMYLLGNTIGGVVSLITAALDNRVAGVATVAAFSPWRASNKNFESLKIYSHWHGFLPRLGFFADNPASAPIDFPEIIAAAAPKPMLLITPDIDRYTNIPLYKNAMEPVKHVYRLFNNKDELMITYPHEINRMTREMYKQVGDFFDRLSR